MTNNSLIGSLPIYAQHLSEQTGVKVVVEGKTAYTDGQKVVVPFNLDDLPCPSASSLTNAPMSATLTWTCSKAP